ncbi:MAG: cysteine--tRNA ligase [Deltaproteobacteria bacterium]|nr:cysteine--tRNA ligase [Deltaproteobacteria bacterium]
MAIYIYNTMSGQKEPLIPLTNGHVNIYVCGPTVYDMSHIGHARAYIAFDVVVRYLRRSYKVTYVRNYTDIDDKIIKRAAETNSSAAKIAERFINEYKKDMQVLSVLPADHEPQVTQYISEIIELISTLASKGFAYNTEGDVYYAVTKFDKYGALSKRNLEDIKTGARVELNEKKQNPLDFALWKAAKPGEPAWDSPWGKGRPGWHIECSAMSQKLLGETFDIHGGGKDLIFPHHENEIAQSQAATDKPIANLWMHNGFVNIDNEKMSKSLGNFFTIREVLEKFDPQALRYFLLTTHYRSPISFSDAALKEAEARVRYIYQTLARLEQAVQINDPTPPYREAWVGNIIERFVAAMDDDFNTAKAFGDLSDVFKLINDTLDRPQDNKVDQRTLSAIQKALKEIAAILGVFDEDPQVVLKRLEARRINELQVDATTIENLISERTAARKNKDFARADAIRQELAVMGVTIKDHPGGTSWEVS